ncbi:hypothetical protein [Undibacterium sp.]|uniref:hypothetical protein n=1 Tax=Undibacterium sp. TaxID=1914977 RepID=UPI00374DB6B6
MPDWETRATMQLGHASPNIAEYCRSEYTAKAWRQQEWLLQYGNKLPRWSQKIPVSINQANNLLYSNIFFKKLAQKMGGPAW